jgi:hypothetical protein
MSPPEWSKLTKSVSDLFKKDFDFGFNVKNTNKASKGLKFETAGCNTASGVAGSVKVDYNHSDFGKVEAKVHTAGRDSDTNAKITFNKLSKGLEVSLAANAAPDLTLEGSYKADQFTAKLAASTNLDSAKHRAGVSATFGSFSGITLGGNVGASIGSSGSADVNDYNAGLTYGLENTTLGLVTSKKFDGITASVFHKYGSDTNLGLRLTSNLSKGTNDVDFGFQHALSSASSVKVRGNSAGVFGVSYVQKLSAPTAKFSFALERSLLNNKGEKFGLGLHFGDY